jgi:hypothetical protein
VVVFRDGFKKKIEEQGKRKKCDDSVFICSTVKKEYETKWKE